jgi:hypothetical protein
MKIYHPSKTPSPEEWLELDESMRINLVKNSHAASGVEFEEGAEVIHFVIHVVVENQLALKVNPVPETIAKLTRQGLSRHEAIHAVGAVLSSDLFVMMKNNQEHDIKKYRKRLDKLTAKRWSKGKW